jgi:hypothetical protein
MRIPLLALVAMLGWTDAAAAAWQRPVPGAVARPFTYAPAAPFRAGAHRGVDLRAEPGDVIRAACAGVVATASAGLAGGAAGGAGVVTLRCGPWRVTALPLASVTVRAGERVGAGAQLGRVGAMPGHTGLHLGVRRASDRFAYVDPLPLLTGETPPPVAGVPRTGPRPDSPARPGEAPPHASAPRTAARPAAGVRVPSGGLAPWPAWVGLALLALGAVGGGVRVRVRRARARARVAVPSPP